MKTTLSAANRRSAASRQPNIMHPKHASVIKALTQFSDELKRSLLAFSPEDIKLDKSGEGAQKVYSVKLGNSMIVTIGINAPKGGLR